jgi:lysophospholipase L1-like esterase
MAFRGTAAILVAALCGAPIAADQAHRSWSEAFQSSPADYTFVVPKNLALPPEARARLRDRPPVIGTLRFRFAVAVSGSQVRIRISNEEGVAPLNIAAASVGIAADGFDARWGSLRRLTFGGAQGIAIAPGSPALSDPVALPVSAMTELVVSLDVPGGLKLKPFGNAVMAMAAGDQTLSNHLAEQDTIIGRPPVSGALVLNDHPPRIVVALGDSITDGNRPVPGQLRGWPERLERSILASPDKDRIAVINAGIGGNRVLSTDWGKAAVARFDRDVLRIRNVSYVVLLEGINDIGNGGPSRLLGNNPPLDVDSLITGYRQIIARAHAANVRVIMGTLTPFEGSALFDADREQQRERVNRWIRTSGEPDAVIDFDVLTNDPGHPLRLRPDFDSGDHLHPNEMGYRAMADGIDLRVLGIR